MDLRRARAPIALIMLLALGIWAASAFADGVVTVATTVVTDTVPTDPTTTSPSTDPTTTTGTSTSPVTSTTPADTATSPVVTTTTPAADTTPVGGAAGSSTTPDTGSAPANDPGTGSGMPAAGSAGQTAAGTASAGAAAVKAKRTHKVKTRRARSSGAAVRGPRPLRAPVGGIISKKKRHRHASSTTSSPTTQTSTTGTTGTTTTVKANGSKAKSLHSSKGKHPTATGAAHANGGRDDAPTASIQPTRPPAEDHGAMGIETPRGRVSISPTGFRIGGSQRSIASVNGLLTAVLDTLAVLAALAAIIGAGAVLSRVRRNRQAARRRARVVPVERRTRQELYAEARRRNIPGRSNMTKAQLELALYPPQPAREQRADRVQRVRGRHGRLPRIDGVDQLGQAK